MNLKKLSISAIVVGLIAIGSWADIITTHFVASTDPLPTVDGITLGLDATINSEYVYKGKTYLGVTLDVTPGYGDIIGVFFDFDKSISTVPSNSITTLCIDNSTGSPVLRVNNEFSYNIGDALIDDDVTSVGHANINLIGLGYTYDIGIQTGIGGDNTSRGGDIDPVTVLFNNSLGLTAADISNIGIRMQSVGIYANARSGSAKLDYAPDASSVPEPSILSLIGFSLLGLSLIRRKKS
jgi:hypothetical protein